MHLSFKQPVSIGHALALQAWVADGGGFCASWVKRLHGACLHTTFARELQKNALSLLLAYILDAIPVRVVSATVYCTSAHSLTDQAQCLAMPAGSSFGGWQALHLAVNHPKEVAGLVLIAPALDITEQYWSKLTLERQRAARQTVCTVLQCLCGC